MNPTAMAETWFHRQGWEPFPFQQEVWLAYWAGESGLMHAPTGTGKTYAAWWAALLEWLAGNDETGLDRPSGLRVLWLTPMRALAADTERALLEPLADLELPWTVERRTGDTSSYAKGRQLRKPPNALITTPESLSLLLSQPGAQSLFRDLRLVVVDEWHELMGSKRGVQAELCLARLRAWLPELRTWGLSATLGNLDTALAALLGVDSQGYPRPGRLVRGLMPKEIIVDSLIPEQAERFPWAGHLGLKMLPQVVAAIEEGGTTLVFTNTRNQTEQWYQAILRERPDWASASALHHGSLDAGNRRWVEEGLRAGRLRCVVCTSSLDLGVDFSPVDRVLQIGSPKGVARLLQRAGRSGHQPGVASRVTCVPTHALELVEVAAVRDALAQGRMEAREPVDMPLDLLVQHLVTVGLGGGFQVDAMLREVRTAYAYRHLSDQAWTWTLDFVANGGKALKAYPEYRRLVPLQHEPDGTSSLPLEAPLEIEAPSPASKAPHYQVVDRDVASRHRMSIGTIVSDPAIEVRFVRGGSLGTVTESFVSRLKPGDRFIFAGRALEFVRLQDLTAWVKKARSHRGAVPVWTGTSLPISDELGEAMRLRLAAAGMWLGDSGSESVFEDDDGPEMRAVRPILALQMRLSKLPAHDELLVERLKTREGHHLFFYPFSGKLVHQGLAALFAYRLSRLRPLTFTLTANDYGLELLSPEPAPLDEALDSGAGAPALLSYECLLEHIHASLNASEMAKRQFREIARVAGLVFQGYPGHPKRSRHLQASSGLFYDVFEKYDTGNLLLAQAQREVLSRQLEAGRLKQTLQRLQAGRVAVVDVLGPTPLGLPLLVERMQAQLSSETLADRVRRMQVRWEG